MSKTISFLLLFFLIISFCCQESLANDNKDEYLKTYIDNILFNNITQRYNVIFYIHNYGKDAIPLLIEKIDTDQKAWILVIHPRNSYVFKEALQNYIGVLYAYVIELILGRDSLLPNKIDPVRMILGDNVDNYIYYYGTINCKGRRAFDLEDMKVIKQIYEDWWNKNKDRSVEELRMDWKNGIKPLTGSDYRWS